MVRVGDGSPLALDCFAGKGDALHEDFSFGKFVRGTRDEVRRPCRDPAAVGVPA